MKKIILSILMLSLVVGMVSAVHTSDVTVTTDSWLEVETETGFTVKVENNGAASIWKVRIYLNDYTLLTCGDAPDNWDLNEENNLCEYIASPFMIPGFEEFTLEAETSDNLEDELTITSVDSAGETDDNYVVPTGWTIQSAIDSWEEVDGAINVPAGTYNENVVINKAITLQGDNQNSIIEGSVTITSNDVTIDGFTVTNPDGNIGITANEVNNVEITNNNIHDVGTTLTSGSAQAIRIYTANVNIDTILIEGNEISDIGSLTLAHAGSAGSSAKGIYIGDSGGSGIISDVTIQNNDISKIYASTANWEPNDLGGAGAYGILINHGTGITGKTVDAQILDNTISNLEGLWAHAIGLEGNTPDAVVTGNTISDLTDHKDPTDAVAVNVEDNANADTIGIHSNSFSNVGLGVQNVVDGKIVNAENNEWGVTTYEGVLALTKGLVDFIPWLPADEINPIITNFALDKNFAIIDEPVIIMADILEDRDLASYVLDFGDGNNITKEFAGEHDIEDLIDKTYSYTAEGKYIVTLTVKDASNNTVSKSVGIVVNAEEPDWVIVLSAESMNLISIPLVPEDTDYKEVFDGIRENLDRVWAYTYDESDGKNHWYFAKPTSLSWSTTNTLEKVVPGYGYIIFMKNDDVLYGNAKTISGDSEDEPMIPSEIHLANGYNLIGLFGKVSEPVKDALSSLEFGGAEYWHKVLNVNEVEVTGEMTSGTGYWVSMKYLPNTVTEDYYTYYP